MARQAGQTLVWAGVISIASTLILWGARVAQAEPLFPPAASPLSPDGMTLYRVPSPDPALTPTPDSGTPWQLVGSDEHYSLPTEDPAGPDAGPVFQLDLQQQWGTTTNPSTGAGFGNGGMVGPGNGLNGDSGIAPGSGVGTGPGSGNGVGPGFGNGGEDPLNAGVNQQGPQTTGLIVDARGLDFQPSMSMRLFDPDGNQVYTTPTPNQELNTYFVATEGTAAYASSEEQARSLTKRIGNRPHLITAKKTLGYDLVISSEDAWLLRQSNKQDRFLDNFSVVVIWDVQSASR